MAGAMLAAVGVSASVSVVTGYLGTLFNFNRVRNRNRRVFGLSLLAEIKSLQRLFRRYYQRFEADETTGRVSGIPKLHFGVTDTSVFNNGSGNLGLFGTRTAVEIVELYSVIRALASQADELHAMSKATGDDSALREALAQHLHLVRLARHHSRLTVVALRKDIPVSLGEAARYARRRAAIRLRRLRRRGQKARSPTFGRLPITTTRTNSDALGAV